MNIAVDTAGIELARLESLIQKTVNELLAVKQDDTVISLSNGWIKFDYLGRGTELIQLKLSNDYSAKTQAFYMTETLARLLKILKDLGE